MKDCIEEINRKRSLLVEAIYTVFASAQWYRKDWCLVLKKAFRSFVHVVF